MKANSSASGMVDGDDQPGAKVVEEKDQHRDDQQHAEQQILLDHAEMVSATRSLRS